MELFEKYKAVFIWLPPDQPPRDLSLYIQGGLSPLPGTDLRKRLLRIGERCCNHRTVGDKQLAEEQLGDPRDQMGGLRCKGTVRECVSQEAFGSFQERTMAACQEQALSKACISHLSVLPTVFTSPVTQGGIVVVHTVQEGG